MRLNKQFEKVETRNGPPPSSMTNVVPSAPESVRALAKELNFETDNLQLRIEFRSRVFFAHDFVHETQTGMDALRSFDAGQVIEASDLENPTHVDPNDPDIAILKERVENWKRDWTPHQLLKVGGIRNMTDLLTDESAHGAVLDTAIPG
jgi:hypothetical protein